MAPQTITIRRGTNRPVSFVMPSDFDMPGKSFELVVAGGGQRWVYTQASGLSVSGQSVTWTYPLADTQAWPEGQIATVELQWTAAGIQDTDIFRLLVEPGISND
jgi:hypothetical protein